MWGRTGGNTIKALAFTAGVLALTAAAPPALTVQEARASTAGAWRGELQYRDYQSNEWIGIPVNVTIEPVGDGVTLLRRAVFDDGPARGAVYVTTLEMLAKDGATEYTTSFRAGREPEIDSATLAMTEARGPDRWTIVATRSGTDDDRPANIRETLTRDGVTLTSLKEVDFTDDTGEAWLQRNRTVLTKAG
jgi:hypothetical protein